MFTNVPTPCYHLGDKYDLIDTSSTTESVTPFTPRVQRRNQPPLSSRLAELNEEFSLDNESRVSSLAPLNETLPIGNT